MKFKNKIYILDKILLMVLMLPLEIASIEICKYNGICMKYQDCSDNNYGIPIPDKSNCTKSDEYCCASIKCIGEKDNNIYSGYCNLADACNYNNFISEKFNCPGPSDYKCCFYYKKRTTQEKKITQRKTLTVSNPTPANESENDVDFLSETIFGKIISGILYLISGVVSLLLLFCFCHYFKCVKTGEEYVYERTVDELGNEHEKVNILPKFAIERR